VLARHHLENGIGLAMAPRAQHDAVIGPFHALVLVSRE
jgi:hypothetical protein